MNCQETRELFSEYLDRRLAPSQSEAIAEHLGGCPDCRLELTALERTVSLLGELEEIEAGPDFVAGVEKRIAAGGWLRRARAWLFEPMRIKLPLEAAALVILTIVGMQLVRSPEFSPQKELSPLLRERETAARAGRSDAAKPRGESERSFRAARPGAPPASVGEPAAGAPGRSKVEPKTEALEVLRSRVPEARVKEIVARDARLYHGKVKALVAEFGGRVTREASLADGGSLVTVELPESRETSFLARLDQEAEGRLVPGFSGERAADALAEHGKAAGEARAARQESEPLITLQLRILPKP